jgi:septin family protein
MTSVLHYRDPIAYRSDYMSASSYHSPHMDGLSSKKSPPYDGQSSGDDSRKHTPGSKKRPSRAGTRSVTTLTAAQLERKRANDREAQRAIRQRTKDHIDALERQVRDLNAQLDNSPSSRMMELMRRNEELEQENAVLRARLGHAVSALAVPEHGTGM